MTKTNEQKVNGPLTVNLFHFSSYLSLKIKEEAARRKALREAKLRMNEAITTARKTKSPEEIAAEMAREAERQREAELLEQKMKEEKEKADRLGESALM